MVSSGKPSRANFATDVSAAIRALSGVDFEYDADSFQLVQRDATEQGIIRLANLYEEHCRLNRLAQSDHIRRIASIIAGRSERLPDEFDLAKKKLLPKIWNRFSFEQFKLQRQLEHREPPDIPLEPLGSHLYSSLVYDTEHAIRSISNADLGSWGVTYDEAFGVAIENLALTSTTFNKTAEYLYSSVAGDRYDSARLLLLGRVLSVDIGGEYVASVPHRDAMLVTGSDDSASLKVLLELAESEKVDGSRPLCPLPLVLEDGNWRDWVPPKNHVLRATFDQLEAHFLGQLYGQQKQLLDMLFEARGENTFVSSFSAARQPGSNQTHTFCVWGRGINALLPRTQVVLFADEEGSASGEWEHVVSVVGDLMEPDDSYYPIRYRISEYPSAEQLSAIGTEASFR